MITKRMELCHGVWLNMIQTDRFKTGYFSFNLLRQLDEKTASVNALIPSVLLRGSREYPDIQSISQQLDLLYGASVGSLIRKEGEVQTIGLSADFLEDRYVNGEPVFAQMMELIRSLLFHPCMEDGGFCEEYVAGEKQNLVNTILSRINDKRSYAIARLLKHMCAGERFGVPRLGEIEPLEAVNGKMLYLWWQELLATSRIEVFYLGQQSVDTVLEQMRQLIACLPERADLVRVQTTPVQQTRSVQCVEESMNVTQGKLTMGFRTPITAHDARYPALMMMNAVFGAGMTSKLFMKIREEQSLCYYASSSLVRTKGMMLVTSGIEFDQYETAKNGILEQLELCKAGQITKEELEGARNYLMSGLRTYHDSQGQMDDFAISQAIAGLDFTIPDLIGKLENVTLQEVIEAANTLTLDTIYFLKGVDAV